MTGRICIASFLGNATPYHIGKVVWSGRSGEEPWHHGLWKGKISQTHVGTADFSNIKRSEYERNGLIWKQWFGGMSKLEIARAHHLSKTRVSQIILRENLTLQQRIIRLGGYNSP